MEEEAQRNKEIYEKKKGLVFCTECQETQVHSYDKLAKEYKRHISRIIQIVKNYELKYGKRNQGMG